MVVSVEAQSDVGCVQGDPTVRAQHRKLWDLFLLSKNRRGGGLFRRIGGFEESLQFCGESVSQVGFTSI